MKRILTAFVLGVALFFGSHEIVFAKDTYILCGDKGARDFKYSKSLFGKDKFFYDDAGEWIKQNKASVSKDKIISQGWTFKSNCKTTCNSKYVISLIYRENKGKKFASVRQILTDTDGRYSWCQIDTDLYPKNCKQRDVGYEVNEYRCEVIEK